MQGIAEKNVVRQDMEPVSQRDRSDSFCRIQQQ
jgi:hypothetical protein